jgi:hypothetical protein
MAAFVIPNHNNTRFFNGPLGNSGVEEIAIQQGIVGCNDQFNSFLYLDPWVGGSRLVYKGGIGRAGETDKCFYMGLFKSDTTNPRGPVLRQDDSTFGDYDELGFLEVINGPL